MNRRRRQRSPRAGGSSGGRVAPRLPGSRRRRRPRRKRVTRAVEHRSRTAASARGEEAELVTFRVGEDHPIRAPSRHLRLNPPLRGDLSLADRRQ
ncbi:hypothetical protein E1258_12400 [Micromonospora sp. KC207]|nr:hypothetical protein E1258_12400 [Micromonospora sp. KC207]